MRVPPFLGINLHTIELHAEVNVIAAGHPGHSAQAHHLASLHHVPFVHIYPAKVSVNCLQSVAVVHDNAIAVNAKRSGINHLPVIRSLNSSMCGGGEVVTQVCLHIDLPALVDVAARVGKSGLVLCTRLSEEWLRP